MGVAKSLLESFLDLRRSSNTYDAFLRSLAACRVLLFPARIQQLRSLGFMQKYYAETAKRDTFSFLTHNYYLSRRFTLAQRVETAINHYGYERQNYDTTYQDLVYNSHGLVLWQRVVNATAYTLRLLATEDNRHEGDLSVLLFVNDARICRMSFSYVNTGVFGTAPGTAMFITRNQTDRNKDGQLFRDTFKQNFPSNFCLAAVCGIAMANGMRNIFAVKHDAQIAYDEQYVDGFRNSYSEFWRKFGAEQVDPQSYRLSVTLSLAPLSQVEHKNRAVSRRRNWAEIIQNAGLAMLRHRTSHDPPPMMEELRSVFPALAGVSRTSPVSSEPSPGFPRCSILRSPG